MNEYIKKTIIRKVNNKKSNKMLKLHTCYHTEILILMFSVFLFKIGCSQMISSASLCFNQKEDEAWSMIKTQISSHTFLKIEFSLRCCKMWNFESASSCSLILLVDGA